MTRSGADRQRQDFNQLAERAVRQDNALLTAYEEKRSGRHVTGRRRLSPAKSTAGPQISTIGIRLVRAGLRESRCSRTACCQFGQLARRSWPDAGGQPSRPAAWAGYRPSSRYLPGLANSSICASVWLVKEALITKLGWPMALPRFTRRPSDRRMMRLPSGNSISSTCGFTLCHLKFFRWRRPESRCRNGRCCRRWRGPSWPACARP